MRMTALAAVAILGLFGLFPVLAAAAGLSVGRSHDVRTLSFYNTHTREKLTVAYWRDGRYDSQALERVNNYLRDHRNGHVHEINYNLLNLLSGIRQELHHRYPRQEIVFNVISGYRSPDTNAMLRANGGGQAKKSRHMEGDAIDIRVPGIDTAEIRDIAWCMQKGGVGYYKGEDFVHVDTHKVRHWKWSPRAGMCNNRGNS